MTTKDKERFWSFVKKTNGCWEWVGGIKSTGRGNFWLNGKTEIAPRVSWAIDHGGELPKLCVLHTCDNGRCVRPTHLFLGTLKDNTQDMLKKRRFVGNTKIQKDVADKIRASYRFRKTTYKDIATQFNVHKSTIGKIIRKERMYAN